MRHHPVKACAIINIPPAAPAFEPPPPDIPVLYSPLTGCIQSRCCPAGESWSQSSSCSGHCSAACAAASAGRAWLARGRGRVKGQKSLRSKRVWREGWAGSMTWPLPPSLLRDASHTSGWRDAPWQGAGPFPKMTREEDDCDDVEEEDDQVLQGEMGTIQGLVYKHSSYQSLPGYFSVFHHPARLPQTDRGKKRRDLSLTESVVTAAVVEHPAVTDTGPVQHQTTMAAAPSAATWGPSVRQSWATEAEL